ncbi:hypothetical protein [Micromonospora sp. NPDC005171]|uniref:hypothetical protein n=1 Tax=Micromonospora sp. NPDC005171 TaxID=3156866 RepID=UPI0033BAADDA
MSKLAVIYHSAFGTSTQIAKAIAGAAEAAGAEVGVRKAAELAHRRPRSTRTRPQPPVTRPPPTWPLQALRTQGQG